MIVDLIVFLRRALTSLNIHRQSVSEPVGVGGGKKLTPVWFSSIELYDPFPTFNYTGSVRAVYPLSPRRTVPDSIPKPDYHTTGIPKSEFAQSRGTAIQVCNEEEIKAMREACRVK